MSPLSIHYWCNFSLYGKITSPNGDSEPPDHDTQPNGDAIPWGSGCAVSGGGTSETINTDDVRPDTNRTSQGGQGDGTPTDDPPSSARMDHSKSSFTATSSTAGSSSYRTANSQHAHSTHDPRPTSSTEAAEDIPAASLPSKKAHASTTGLASPTAGMSCSGMGPGVPQVGGMKLASGAPVQRDPWWLEVILLPSVFFVVLL